LVKPSAANNAFATEILTLLDIPWMSLVDIIQTAIWASVIVTAPFNHLSALLRARTDEISNKD
jgi:ketopantoate reductase